MITLRFPETGPFDEPADTADARLAWADRVIRDGGDVRCFSGLPLLRLQRRVAEGVVDIADVRVFWRGKVRAMLTNGQMETWPARNPAFDEIVEIRKAQRAREAKGGE